MLIEQAIGETYRVPQGPDSYIGPSHTNGHSNGHLSDQLPLGDLQDREHPTRIEVLNNAWSQTALEIDELLSGHYPEVPPHLQNSVETAQSLRDKLKEFSQQNSFPSEVSAHMNSLMHNADESTQNASQETKAAVRIANFDKIHLVADHDGTWTDLKGELRVNGTGFVPDENYLPHLIPLSAHAEKLLKKHGRNAFPEIYAALWQPALKDPLGYHLFWDGGRHTPLRPGASELVQFTDKIGAKLTFVSQNFEPFVQGSLEQTPSPNPMDIVAITPDNINTFDKSAVLHVLAKHGPKAAIIFMGDGQTDDSVIEAYRNGIVAAIFALEGEGFDRRLTQEEIPHFTFRNLHDIRTKLEEILELSSNLRTSNGSTS